MAAVATNGGVVMEGRKVGEQEQEVEEDGYFTCAVSVQHKKHDFETSSSYSASDSEQAGRRVVWPAPLSSSKQTLESSRQETSSRHETSSRKEMSSRQEINSSSRMVQSSHQQTEQQKTSEQGGQRIGRSSSRSNNILDRARSFDRGPESSSRPASRTGSAIGGSQRSASGQRVHGGGQDEAWAAQLERPGSRTDVDSRRFGEIGRVSTTDWEERIRTGSQEILPTRTPPPKRRELRRAPEPDSKTPEPPLPPTRSTYPPNTIKATETGPDLPDFPPPPDLESKSSKLSEESVGQLTEENKENIVMQWVESTTQSAEKIDKELERFAYDIAESVVSNMEKNSEKKEMSSTSGVDSAQKEQKQQLGSSGAYYVTPGSSGVYFASPARANHQRELHGPVYVQEDNRRVGLTFQQEERRREELRKEEEVRQEERRRQAAELESKKLQEELEARRIQEEQQRLKAENEFKKREEMLRREEEIRQKEALLKKQEELRRQEEMRAEAEKKYQEEQRIREVELKKLEEEKKQQEFLRFEQLKQEEEAKRLEEMRLEQEMRRQYELQQQARKEQLALEEQKRKEAEEQARREQQRVIEEQKRKEAEEQAFREQQREIEEQKRKEAEEQALREKQRAIDEQKRKEVEEQARIIEEQKQKEAEEQAWREQQMAIEEQKRKEAEEQAFRERQRLIEEQKRKEAEEQALKEQQRTIMEQKRKEAEEKVRRDQYRAIEEQKQKEAEEQARIDQQRAIADQKRKEAEKRLKREQQRLLEEQQQREEEQRQKQDRGHIPKLIKTKSFDHSQDRLNEAHKYEDHLGSVKTGQVNEKRSFWNRSTSESRLNQAGLSPAPRRRRIDWGSARQEDTDSRPGSSLGQAVDTGSVRNLSSGFLAKSKSTAAVMEEDSARGRTKHRTLMSNGWTKERQEQHNRHEFLNAKTNKVNETVTSWGRRDMSTSGRSTPSAPSRNIGEVFAENKVAMSAEKEATANSWRTQTPEPTLKLVNVSVEKAVGSNQNIHISENAHAQMANFMQEKQVMATSQQETTESMVQTSSMTNTMSSQSSSTSKGQGSITSSITGSQLAPPPAPERKQSYGGKCETPVWSSSSETATTPTPANTEVLSDVESVNHNKIMPPSTQDQMPQAADPIPCSALQNSTSTQNSNSVLPATTQTPANTEVRSAVESVGPVNHNKIMPPSTQDQMPQATVSILCSALQNSTSTQSINSVLPATTQTTANTGVQSAVEFDGPVTHNKKMPPSTQDQMPQAVDPILCSALQNSTSTQSINSVLSTCSSSALPVPVRQGWFTDPPGLAPATTTSSHPQPAQEGVFSPTRTGKTPLPVIANWIDKLESSLSKEKALNDESKIVTDIKDESEHYNYNKVIVGTCENETKDMLNEMFDNLVSEQGTIEILESSGETETMKRKKREQVKSLTSDDIDKWSVKSDLTVIEKKDVSTLKDYIDQSNVFPTHHSPMVIRKKFQDANSFEKNFTKITDVELSEEFKEGIKGKVKDSKESFLKQVATDTIKVDSQQKKDEIDLIKFNRTVSMSEDVVKEKFETKKDPLKEENPTLVNNEQIFPENPNSVQSSYQQEQKARKIELLQLANRTCPANNDNEAGNRGLQIRQERNKELAELVHRRTDVEPDIEDKAKAIKDERSQELSLLMNRKLDTPMEFPEDKTAAMKEARRKELEELVNRKVEFDWTCNTKEKTIKEERARELYEIANRKTLDNQPKSTDLCMDDKLRQERAAELKQISEIQSISSLEMGNKNENPNLLKTNDDDLLAEKSDLRGSVRNTAAVWKERERSGSQDIVAHLDKESAVRDLPTRRIGSLFRNDPDYWKLSEPEEPDLPAPPTELSETNMTVTNPPPPPRQSSRGKMEEYSRDSGWSAPWRST